MIIDGLYSLLDAIVLGPLIALLPESDFGQFFPESGTAVRQWIFTVDQWVPIHGPLSMVLAVLRLWPALVLAGLLILLWRLLPGKAS